MRRTTISLPDDLAGRLEREARRRHTSVSEVVRGALTDFLGLNRPPQLPFDSLGSSGHTDTAEKLEELLVHEWSDAVERDRDR